MKPLDTWTTELGTVVKIVADDDPQSPREWDNIGTIAYAHKRYTLGDEEIPGHAFDGEDGMAEDAPWEAARAHYEREVGPRGVVLPLCLYDHSGLTLQVGYASGWDCGQVGFIYANEATIRKEYSVAEITEEVRDRVTEALRCEIETYAQYLAGEVFGYVVENAETGDEESCWGFFGSDCVRDEANSIARYLDEKIRQKRAASALPSY